MKTHEERMAEGERTHNQYLEDLSRATPEQIEAARRGCQEHMSEYGASFAAILHEVLEA